MIISISACGFKVVDKSSKNNFSIKEITTTGDKRINFKIRNNLLINSSEEIESAIYINLDTKKTKSIKEKNIKNQITKYKISLETNVELNSFKNSKVHKFSLVTEGDYLIGDNNSSTINNEKKLIDGLVEEISNQIEEEISLRLNDL